MQAQFPFSYWHYKYPSSETIESKIHDSGKEVRTVGMTSDAISLNTFILFAIDVVANDVLVVVIGNVEPNPPFLK